MPRCLHVGLPEDTCPVGMLHLLPRAGIPSQTCRSRTSAPRRPALYLVLGRDLVGNFKLIDLNQPGGDNCLEVGQAEMLCEFTPCISSAEFDLIRANLKVGSPRVIRSQNPCARRVRPRPFHSQGRLKHAPPNCRDKPFPSGACLSFCCRRRLQRPCAVRPVAAGPGSIIIGSRSGALLRQGPKNELDRHQRPAA